MPEGTFPHGLYESLVTEALATRLDRLPDDRHAQTDALRTAEAADRIAWHIASVVERAIEMLPESERTAAGVELARSLVDRVVEGTAVAELSDQRPFDPARDPAADRTDGQAAVLRAVHRLNPDGSPKDIDAPLIPLLDSALLTNSPGEPAVGHQVAAEIASADSIDLIMAFIRLSGIRPLREKLRKHVEAGGRLRVLTTTYTGSTEAAALDWLAELGADVRVSYDTTSTRLHAKAWLFRRDSGFSTAYVGSSNLTHWAQATGLEWNVRISGARNRSIIEKVAAVFESYWEEADFEPYDRARFALAVDRDRPERERLVLSAIEIHPYPFQERLLEQIELSPYTFAHALRDASFGELWVGGRRPEEYEHVFASIQSLNASGVDAIPPDHFDVVIVDEFHHAAAASYTRLLEHLEPVEFLGLTATPERSDGLPVLHWFDDRIATELRLWDAIDQHRLTHRQEFRYDRRFRALLGGTRTDVMKQVEQGFPFVAAAESVGHPEIGEKKRWHQELPRYGLTLSACAPRVERDASSRMP